MNGIKITEGIKHLIIVNIILFVAPQIINLDLTNIFALHFPKNNHFGIWQYITHMFMHGSFPHILFNMYGLWAFGTPLEKMWGRNKFLFFYISCGLGAAFIQTGFYYFQVQNLYEILELNNLSSSSPDIILEYMSQSDYMAAISGFNSVMVGASGAIYGVLVAFAFSFPNSKLMLLFFPFPIKAKLFVPLLILIDLFFGISSFSVGPIAHFAHIGGALIGLIMLLYWKKNQFNDRRWD